MAQHWTHQGGGWLPPRAPRPGVIPLRPLAPREMLGGALTALRRYGGRLLGALLLGQLGGLLLTFPQLAVGLLYADRRLRGEHRAGSLTAEPLITST
ncbi:hypothetical protein [Streptomyces erythrochromogenes]|uniref:hypothetical protein n=1 Tax=Streptomyces erythrochromogenes TaxID=285574 RepID=UPI00380D0F5B